MKKFWPIGACLIGLLLFGCSNKDREKIHVVYTGSVAGYLEPCGCREGRIGGMARWAGALRDSLSRWKESPLILDAGDFAEIYGSDMDAKNRTLLETFSLLHYDAINVTAQDLIAGVGTLTWARDSLHLPLISANLGKKGMNDLLFPGWIIKPLGGKKIGIIGVGMVRPLEMRRARADSLEFKDPETAIRAAEQQIRSQCDVTILLCDLTARSSREMAARIPGIDIVISSMELAPTTQARKFGHAYVLGPSRKGKMLTMMSLAHQPGDSLRLDLSSVLLDSTVRDDPKIAELVASQKKLNFSAQKP